MKLDEVLKLIDAGYTKEDIQAFESETPAPAEPTPAPEPTPEPAPEPAAPEPAAPEYGTEHQRLEALLKQFIGIAQQNNINASMNEQGMKRSDTDILAAVINPPRKEKQ